MKVDALIPAVSGRLRFSLADKKRVPDEPGCYALAAADDEVLYVGLAKDLKRRFGNHADDDEKRAAVQGMKVVWFTYLQCLEADLARVERGWMNQYMTLHGTLPPLNKVYSPVR